MRVTTHQSSRQFASDMLMLKAISEVEQLILTITELECRHEMITLILAPAWTAFKGSLNLLRYALLGFQYAVMTEHWSSMRTLHSDTSRPNEPYPDDVPSIRQTNASSMGPSQESPASSTSTDAEAKGRLSQSNPTVSSRQCLTPTSSKESSGTKTPAVKARPASIASMAPKDELPCGHDYHYDCTYDDNTQADGYADGSS